jgi:hypothetical protein
MGELPTAALAEPGLRVMAREDRTIRRALGSAFASALSEAERQKQDRFARVILPNRAFGDPEAVAYVFLILAYPTGIQLKKGYQQYRNTRVAMLLTYCQAVLYEHRTLKRAIGIALDASSRVTGRQGGSEDLVMFEVSEWTPDLEREVEERRSRYDVLVPERIRVGRYSMQEYPELPEQLPSRQQRRYGAAVEEAEPPGAWSLRKSARAKIKIQALALEPVYISAPGLPPRSLFATRRRLGFDLALPLSSA